MRTGWGKSRITSILMLPFLITTIPLTVANETIMSSEVGWPIWITFGVQWISTSHSRFVADATSKPLRHVLWWIQVQIKAKANADLGSHRSHLDTVWTSLLHQNKWTHCFCYPIVSVLSIFESILFSMATNSVLVALLLWVVRTSVKGWMYVEGMIYCICCWSGEEKERERDEPGSSSWASELCNQQESDRFQGDPKDERVTDRI